MGLPNTFKQDLMESWLKSPVITSEPFETIKWTPIQDTKLVSHSSGNGILGITEYEPGMELDVVPKPSPKVSKEFVLSCLSDIEADNKTWGWYSKHSNIAHVYVSAKSSVKKDIFDPEIWKDHFTNQVEFVYKHVPMISGVQAIVDGIEVDIFFLDKGVSVFDLVASIKKPVFNISGFTVMLPTDQPNAPYVDYGDGPNDDIPF
jgi:hypothetical protein